MRVLSLGMGVQSVTLYFLAAKGVIPKQDYAIYADPQAESQATNEYAAWLYGEQDKHGIPILWVKDKNIYNDILNQRNSSGHRFASIPAYTANDGNAGMIRRQCTREYKIEVVHRTIKRKILNLPPRSRVKGKIEIQTGISLDEAHRMKDPLEVWVTKTYPLIDLGMTRGDCEDWLKFNGLPVPPKSSCVFCPYQSSAQWRARKAVPEDWAKIVAVDENIRDMSQRGMRAQIYLHRDLKPISECNFQEDQMDLFGNDCEGGCGL